MDHYHVALVCTWRECECGLRFIHVDTVAWRNGKRHIKVAKHRNGIEVVGPLKRNVFNLGDDASLRYVEISSRERRVGTVVQKRKERQLCR